jgi:hypothetical protein
MRAIASKLPEKERDFTEFLADIDKFHAENSKYLSEFKVDNSKIEELTSKAEEFFRPVYQNGGSIEEFEVQRSTHGV